MALPKLSQTTENIIKASSIVGAIIVLASGYTFFKNNLWKPKIIIEEIDFDKGTANLTINGDAVKIYGDSVFNVGADWGVRLGQTYFNGNSSYDRIELLKNGMVVDYLKIKD
jgi:hypothetical protein